jgi:ribosome-associated translation inhibitor RaiA
MLDEEEGMIGIRGVGADRTLRARIRARLDESLRRLGVAPIEAMVVFVDDNGPKGGPAQRCALTVRLPYRPALRVEHTATTSRLAFDGAFAALEPRLERYRERQRESRRYPKKYYAAKRLLTGE